MGGVPTTATFLFEGPAAWHTRDAQVLIAATHDLLGLAATARHIKGLGEKAAAGEGALAELGPAFSGLGDAFERGDAGAFKAARVRLVRGLNAVADPAWTGFVERVRPSGGEIPLRDVVTPAAFAGPFRSMPGRSPTFLFSGPVQARIRIEGDEVDLLKYSFYTSRDVAQEAETLTQELIEPLARFPYDRIWLLLRGGSRSTREMDASAGEVLRALSRGISSIAGLKTLFLKLATGDRWAVYRLDRGLGGTEPAWRKVDQSREVVEGTPPPVLFPRLVATPGTEGRIVESVVPAGSFSEGLTLHLLVRALDGAMRSFPYVETITVDLSLGGLELDLPLARTWLLVRELPIDIFPPRREVRLVLKFGEKAQVAYGLFRGEPQLRRSYFDQRGERWEVLELRSAGIAYEVLVRERSKDPLGVEVHIDPNLPAYANQSFLEAAVRAAEVIRQRKGLGEIVFVMESDHPNPHRFENLARILIRQIGGELLGFQGFLTLAVVKGHLVWEYRFGRTKRGALEMVGSSSGTLKSFPHPPSLYPPPTVLPEIVIGAPPKDTRVPDQPPTQERPLSLREILTSPLGDLVRRRRRS